MRTSSRPLSACVFRRLPGDGPSDSRRKVLQGDTEELWRTEQAALLDVRRKLLRKKRELCRLCREEEGLGGGTMARAQEEYDEILLQLQDQREELALLKVEEQCLWLTDEESVIRYLEHVQQQVAERGDELANVMALEKETQERQRQAKGGSGSGGLTSRGGSSSSAGGEERGAPAASIAGGAPPASMEMVVPQPRSPLGVGGASRAPAPDARVLVERARAMIDARSAGARAAIE